MVDMIDIAKKWAEFLYGIFSLTVHYIYYSSCTLPCCTSLLYYIIASLNYTNCTNIHGIVLK